MAVHKVKRPQPLLTRAAIVSAIGTLSTLLVTFGVIPAVVGQAIAANAYTVVAALAALVAAVSPVVHAFVARGAVTPTAAPQDAAGLRLVPVGSAPAVLDAAVALAQAEKIFPLR